MIKVKKKFHNDALYQVKIEGHAMYDVLGKDIVCAAVSTMSTTTINNILTLDKEAIKYEVKKGSLLITVNDDNEMAIKLLNNMLNMLRELCHNYPKNIELED